MKKKCSNIKIELKDKEKIYNAFDENKLSDDLGRYIYTQRSSFEINKDIEIDIYFYDNMSSNEKDNIVNMIHEYFKDSVKEMSYVEKQDRIKKILLLILGTILIFLSHLINLNNDFIISEILLIVGWVSIWEVFDNILFRETKRKFRLNIYKKLSICKINIILNNVIN